LKEETIHEPEVTSVRCNIPTGMQACTVDMIKANAGPIIDWIKVQNLNLKGLTHRWYSKVNESKRFTHRKWRSIYND